VDAIFDIRTHHILTAANTGAVTIATDTVAIHNASPSITTFWTCDATTINIGFVLVLHIVVT
jgi:hypothetical protein